MTQILRIFLSSPGDVAAERQLARDAIAELQREPQFEVAKLETVSWDDPQGRTPLVAQLDPQTAVERGLPKPSDCDVVVGIFWARMGSPLPEEYQKADGSPFLSGTEYELEDAFGAKPGPDVLLYRRSEEPQWSARDPAWQEKREQLRLLDAYLGCLKATLRYIDEYATPSELKDRLKNDLRKVLARQLRMASIVVTDPQVSPVAALKAWHTQAEAELAGVSLEALSALLQPTKLPVILQTFARPQLTDLFEIVRDPVDVPAAILRAGAGRAIAPYDVPHEAAREGVENIQTKLYEELLGSGGALLVQSRAGLGKTREVAGLAACMCADGWTVCVARTEGDLRMEEPAAFPDELRDSRVLFVVDDLHRRVVFGASNERPYSERLGAFLDFVQRALAPGELYAVATSRSEPYAQKQLRLQGSDRLWGRFKIFTLPGFRLEGLQDLLVRLTEWAEVRLDGAVDAARRMVRNSDRTPRTLVMNVDRARQRGEPLSLEQWLPTQGGSWDARFQEARGRWSAVGEVYQSLDLVRQAGLPARMAYVERLGSAFAGSDVTPAAEGLVDMGLLGLHSGVLDAFADEQLRESLRAGDVDLLQVDDHWEFVAENVIQVARAEPAWFQDLVSLASRLARAEKPAQAEAAASAAIDHGSDDGEIYIVRGRARLSQGVHEGVEADLTTAIERGRDESRVYFVRGSTRLWRGDPQGAEADFTAAIERGRDDAEVYLSRGFARLMRDDQKGAETNLSAKGAETDFDAAIERGQDDAEVYFRRAWARFGRDDREGAEADSNAAIERGRDDARVYLVRGWSRLGRGDHEGAEADYTAAIDRDPDGAPLYIVRGCARVSRDDHEGAEADFDAAIDCGWEVSDAYYFRGIERSLRGDFAGAEADYTAALERGLDVPAVYVSRAVSSVRLGKLKEARRDCKRASELAPDHPESHKCWGEFHLGSENYDEAIEGFRLASDAEPDSARRLFDLGAAFLLGGRFGEATAAYENGVAGAKVHQIEDALRDLAFWITLKPDRVSSTSAQEAIAHIREVLEGHRSGPGPTTEFRHSGLV